MKKLLLIETATEVCSAAIATEQGLLALEEEVSPVGHAAILAGQIEDCCRKAGVPLSGIDAVAVSGGPGAYTSLRVGASMAKGLAFGLDIPLISVDTLQAMAHAMALQLGEAGATAALMPMLDARRSEVWTAVYDVRLQVRFGPSPVVFEAHQYEALSAFLGTAFGGERLFLAGNGSFKAVSATLPVRTMEQLDVKCSAENLALIAFDKFKNKNFEDKAYYEPMYMKNPNITKSAKQVF
jgi:tRNA threonylcarbamoyladenosine biosynthesis protein TsaB